MNFWQKKRWINLITLNNKSHLVLFSGVPKRKQITAFSAVSQLSICWFIYFISFSAEQTIHRQNIGPHLLTFVVQPVIRSAFTNIYERMGDFKELTKLERDAVIGCCWCNRSACETSCLLDVPQSSVTGINATWKYFETRNKCQSGSQGLLRCIVCKSLFAGSV